MARDRCNPPGFEGSCQELPMDGTRPKYGSLSKPQGGNDQPPVPPRNAPDLMPGDPRGLLTPWTNNKH